MAHLLSNIFALLFFGFVLENIIGSKRLIVIFIVAGVMASLASTLLYTATLGASGAIFGIIGSLTALKPKMAVYAFGIPMPMAVAAAMWAALDFAGLFYPSDVANLAHLAGLIAGLSMGYVMRKQFKEPRRKKEKILTDRELEVWEDTFMGR